MAVKFRYGLDVLLGDLKRCGYSADLVEKYEVGQRPLTAKIRVSDRTAVNWDRHSLTVWAEGPVHSVRKLERSLKLRGHGGVLERIARKRVGVAVSLLVFFAVACLVAFQVTNTPSRPVRAPVENRAVRN